MPFMSPESNRLCNSPTCQAEQRKAPNPTSPFQLAWTDLNDRVKSKNVSNNLCNNIPWDGWQGLGSYIVYHWTCLWMYYCINVFQYSVCIHSTPLKLREVGVGTLLFLLAFLKSWSSDTDHADFTDSFWSLAVSSRVAQSITGRHVFNSSTNINNPPLISLNPIAEITRAKIHTRHFAPSGFIFINIYPFFASIISNEREAILL